LLARKRYAVLHLRKKLGYLYEMLNNSENLPDSVEDVETEIES